LLRCMSKYTMGCQDNRCYVVQFAIARCYGITEWLLIPISVDPTTNPELTTPEVIIYIYLASPRWMCRVFIELKLIITAIQADIFRKRNLDNISLLFWAGKQIY
jgi:hypothetical protein